MKQNQLAPYQKSFLNKLKSDSVLSSKDLNDEPFSNPQEAMRKRLWRKTEFWPITISGSIIFPMSVVSQNKLATII